MTAEVGPAGRRRTAGGHPWRRHGVEQGGRRREAQRKGGPGVMPACLPPTGIHLCRRLPPLSSHLSPLGHALQLRWHLPSPHPLNTPIARPQARTVPCHPSPVPVIPPLLCAVLVYTSSHSLPLPFIARPQARPVPGHPAPAVPPGLLAAPAAPAALPLLAGALCQRGTQQDVRGRNRQPRVLGVGASAPGLPPGWVTELCVAIITTHTTWCRVSSNLGQTCTPL